MLETYIKRLVHEHKSEPDPSHYRRQSLSEKHSAKRQANVPHKLSLISRRNNRNRSTSCLFSQIVCRTCSVVVESVAYRLMILEQSRK